MKDNKDKNSSRNGDVTNEESKRRGVRDSGNHDADVVDSRIRSTALSSSPKSNTSQPSERKHRESSSSSPINESRRSGSSHDRRQMSYRDERSRLDYPRHRDDLRHERHRSDRDRSGSDRHERGRFERDRSGRDLHRRNDRHPHGDWGDPRGFHHRRERCDSPPGGFRRSPVDHGRRRSYSESPERSIDSLDSRSRSRSRSRPRSRSNRRSEQRYAGTRRSRSRSRSPPSSSSSVSSSSISSDDDEMSIGRDESTFSKDQRTVFVSQLVMRATEKDIRRYFRRKVGCKVKEVIFLRDKRTKSHKGGAYIEMRRIEDVNKAVAVSGSAPDFQRFPLLIKPSEAEKNYVAPVNKTVVTASMMEASAATAPSHTRDGRSIEVQKVYVGDLDNSVSEEHLFALFSQFGQLAKVTMQLDPATQSRRGFAFLSFGDPKVANLAIHTMANRVLAGRPMRTGWASQPSSAFGVEVVTSDEFPGDLEVRKQRAFAVLEKLNGSANNEASDQLSEDIDSNNGMSDNLIDASNTTSSVPGIRGEPGPNILIHNMFDKDNQTDEGWAEELKEEFTDECSKFGKITAVTVKFKESGGKIFATFDSVDSAKECSENLSGRWFDKRQLQVEYVDESRLPDGHT